MHNPPSAIKLLFAHLLIFTSTLLAQDWKDITSTFNRSQKRNTTFQDLIVKWQDSERNIWHISWNRNTISVSTKNTIQSIKAKRIDNGKDWPEFEHANVQNWHHWTWNCYMVNFSLRGVDLGRKDFIIIATNTKSNTIKLLRGQCIGEDSPTPSVHGNDLIFDWQDESKFVFLNSNHRAIISDDNSHIKTEQASYTVDIFYPVLGSIQANIKSNNPLSALHQGMLSLSWRLSDLSKSGGTASSDFTHPDAETYNLNSTTPERTIVFLPHKQAMNFAWSDSFWVFTPNRKPYQTNYDKVKNLLNSKTWNVIIEKSQTGSASVFGIVQTNHN